MPRPIYAEIDIQALKHNLARLRESVGDRTLWAVVKANAYGHGLENAVEAFADADGFATIDLCDAERARRAGWHKRVLLLEGFFDETDIEPLQDLDVETVVHSMWQIDILKRLQLREVKVHIKVNSGMNRLGFLPVEVGTIYDLLTSIPGVKVMGVVTHFANAEPSYLGDAPASVSRQLTRMGRLAHSATAACMANSAAILWHPEVGGDGVRAGVALYGVSPDSHISSEELGLIPAMTLSAKIIAVQEIAPGEAVGYGSPSVPRAWASLPAATRTVIHVRCPTALPRGSRAPSRRSWAPSRWTCSRSTSPTSRPQASAAAWSSGAGTCPSTEWRPLQARSAMSSSARLHAAFRFKSSTDNRHTATDGTSHDQDQNRIRLQ